MDSIDPADDSWIPNLTARLNRESAAAYAVMKGPDQAERCLAEADEDWEPRDAFQRASADHSAAMVALELGQLEDAEQRAASAVRGFAQGPYRRSQTRAELLLAEVNVRAGEPSGA